MIHQEKRGREPTSYFKSGKRNCRASLPWILPGELSTTPGRLAVYERLLARAIVSRSTADLVRVLALAEYCSRMADRPGVMFHVAWRDHWEIPDADEDRALVALRTHLGRSVVPRAARGPGTLEGVLGRLDGLEGEGDRRPVPVRDLAIVAAAPGIALKWSPSARRQDGGSLATGVSYRVWHGDRLVRRVAAPQARLERKRWRRLAVSAVDLDGRESERVEARA